jgi:hypothetical protein
MRRNHLSSPSAAPLFETLEPRLLLAAAISINDVAVDEGNSGTTTPAVFTVSLSEVSDNTVTVHWATAAGAAPAATAGTDFTSGSGDLSFAPGETAKTVSVTVKGDNLSENNETFYVNLTAPVNATIADSQGVGTILDDDPLPVASIGPPVPAAKNEGMVGYTLFAFTVTLSAAAGRNVNVSFNTFDGTATGGPTSSYDYISQMGGSVLFVAGATSKTITVNVNGDLTLEADETFGVRLSAGSTYTVSPTAGEALATILNDDKASLSIGNTSVTEGDSGTVDMTFTISLNPATGQAIDVNWSTLNGTALADLDYTAASGVVTFQPGDLSKAVTVRILGDTLSEANETVKVNISADTSKVSITTGTGTGTILDNDPLPDLTMSDASVIEGNAGTVNAIFAVTLSTIAGRDITVHYAAADGTGLYAATGADGDYVATSGTLTIPAGQTAGAITVPVNGETKDEYDETFAVNLSAPTNATIAKAAGLATILNDDTPPSLSINDRAMAEGNSGSTSFPFVVTLSAASAKIITVQYATASGTAAADTDYTAATGTLTFNPGQTTQPVTVAVNGDTIFEADESFVVNLSAPTNATVADSQGLGTILNDDMTLWINDVQVTEGDAGTVNATFTVSLSQASGKPITVVWGTVGEEATAPADYTSAGGTLTFAPGETTKTVTVAVNGDLLAEDNETFNVFLSNATNATMADAHGVGTILDDDSAHTGLGNEIPVELVCQWGGSAPSVAVSGHFAYVCLGPSLGVLDVADPANPRLLGSVILAAPGLDVVVSGNLAYVADGTKGLQIIDVSNPAAPALLGGYDTSGGANGVCVSGSLAYVADYGDGLQIIDVSNPAAPVWRGGYEKMGYFGAVSVYVSGTLAYVGDYWGLQIIDVSNPAAPVWCGGYDTGSYTRGVCVSGHLAYLADDGMGLQIVDVANPAAPALLGGYDTRGLARDVYVSSNIAYVANYSTGLQIIDVSNPAAPARRGVYYTSGDAYGVFVLGNLAYVAADTAGLQIIDVSNPAAPAWRGAYATSGNAKDVYVSGNLAYVADVYNGLQIIDVSNPAAPVWRGGYDTSGSAAGVYVSGNLAYVAEYAAGLQIIDVSNPAAPSLRGAFSTGGNAHGVYVSGSRAYVANGSTGGLIILNVSNPAAPVRLGGYNTSGSAHGVYASGNLAYVADYTGGLQIFDVSNPAAPVLRGGYDTSGEAEDVYVSGNLAYVADASGGLQIIDVSNPAAPVRLGGYDTSGYPYDVYVSGNLAYVADSGAGLQIIDVSNPAAPIRRGGYDTIGGARGVYVSGNLAYVADYEGGLVILKVNQTAWTGAADNRWENGGNWSYGAAPGTGVVARIDGAAARQPVMEQDQTVWGLDLAAGGALTFAPGAPKTLLTKSLTIAETAGVPTARLDLASGRLIVDYDGGAASPLEDVKRWIAAGYNGMTWTGNGLASSAAALAPITYGLGYAQNNMLLAPYKSFAGQPVDSSSVLVKYTYAGDLNLDGCVDDNDVAILGLHYDGGAVNTHSWSQGDLFGYDGRIDDNDVSILGLTYGLGVGNPLGGGPVGAVPEPAAATAAPAAVPLSAAAPTSLAAVVLTAAAASLAPATLVDEPAALDAGALALLLSKATPASAAQARSDCRLQIEDCRFKGNNGLPFLQSAICNLQSAIAAPAAPVPPAYGATQEVAPPQPEPVLAPAGETLDLLALSSPGGAGGL